MPCGTRSFDLVSWSVNRAGELRAHSVERIVSTYTLLKDVSVPVEVGCNILTIRGDPGGEVVQLIKDESWYGNQSSVVCVGVEMFIVPKLTESGEDRIDAAHPGIRGLERTKSLEEWHERARDETTLRVEDVVDRIQNRSGVARLRRVVLDSENHEVPKE